MKRDLDLGVGGKRARLMADESIWKDLGGRVKHSAGDIGYIVETLLSYRYQLPHLTLMYSPTRLGPTNHHPTLLLDQSHSRIVYCSFHSLKPN